MLDFLKNLPFDKIITAVVLVLLCLAAIKIILFLYDKLVKKV